MDADLGQDPLAVLGRLECRARGLAGLGLGDGEAGVAVGATVLTGVVVGAVVVLVLRPVLGLVLRAVFGFDLDLDLVFVVVCVAVRDLVGDRVVGVVLDRDAEFACGLVRGLVFDRHRDGVFVVVHGPVLQVDGDVVAVLGHVDRITVDASLGVPGVVPGFQFGFGFLLRLVIVGVVVLRPVEVVRVALQVSPEVFSRFHSRVDRSGHCRGDASDAPHDQQCDHRCECSL